jgi:serine/threonine protein kinase
MSLQAPEVIRHAQGSKSTDVYAFGIVLWELATREEVGYFVLRHIQAISTTWSSFLSSTSEHIQAI